MLKEYRICCDRVFDAWPPFRHRDFVINGAAIGLRFRFYKDGKEVYLADGAECSACDNVICSFDSKDGYRFDVKPIVKEPWFDKMTFEVIEHSFLVQNSDVDEDVAVRGGKTGPDELGAYPERVCIPVEPDEFTRVLKEHLGNFENQDNLQAQALSVWYEKVGN